MTDSSEDKQAQSVAEKRYIDMLDDIGSVMNTPRGRRWVYEIIHNTCHVGRVSHVSGSSDDTAFNEGARSVGLYILEEVKRHSLKNFMLMISENAQNA